jgi:redox-sensitive bicupin YhaK (pirin superfamily)
MTAARGIIHSEMPQQTAGRLRGFQLWLNLPAREKMGPARYQDIPAARIPQLHLPGVDIKVIAGPLELDGQSAAGPVNSAGLPVSTDPRYYDLQFDAAAQIMLPIPAGHSAFLYPYEGEVRIGSGAAALPLAHRSAGVLSDGDSVQLQAGPHGARVLLLAARPLGEPVVQYGPFVMNTRQEIEQAVADFQAGRLAG